LRKNKSFSKKQIVKNKLFRMKKIIMVSTIIAVVMSFSIVINCNSQIVESKKIEIKKRVLLRSSWQTINIGDIAHSPGVLALLEKYLPDVEVRLWTMEAGNGVKEMLQKRFPRVQIIDNSDTVAINAAFKECDFLLHGSGPSFVAYKDVETWINNTRKPFGVYGITLAKVSIDQRIVNILNQAQFVYFRDTVSLELAKHEGVKAPIMEFGPDGAFACDLRNDKLALKFMSDNRLKKDKFLCVIPKYRRTPHWLVPSYKSTYNEVVDKRNQAMKEHDHKPYRDAIIEVIRKTNFKVLICPEDVTQVAIGKEMLYDPLPADVKKDVVWRDSFWLTDEALSVYVRSAGLFGLEQHSPIMCIGNGIPALVGRFEEQTSKGYMWHNIGLGDWFFDSDSKEQMDRLISTVLSLANDPKTAKKKTMIAKDFVEKRQQETMAVIRKCLKLNK
jgi:hypothetical protein